MAEFLGYVQDTYIVMIWGYGHIIERVIPRCKIWVIPETRNVVNDLCWLINIVRFSSSHHYIHMFVKFDTISSFAEAVAGLVLGGGLHKINKFVVSPLQNYECTHIDMPCLSSWFLGICDGNSS